jgi:hypothetical protein
MVFHAQIADSFSCPQEKAMNRFLLNALICTALLATAAVAPSPQYAQSGSAPKDQTSKPSAVPVSADKPSAGDDSTDSLLTAVPLKVSLTPSESPLKIGSTSNIAVDIQNVSTRPVEIDTDSVQLMTPAILSQTDSLCVIPLGPITNTGLLGLLVLQPQDHVSIFFNLSQNGFNYTTEEASAIDKILMEQNRVEPAATQSSPQLDPSQQNLQINRTKYQHIYQQAYSRSCQAGFFGPLKRAIDFTPGNYSYFLSGKFSICSPDGSTPCPLPTRSFGQSATIPVGIDQTLIIIFAVAGGLLAYCVVSVRGTDAPAMQFYSLISSKSSLEGVARSATKDGLVLLVKIARDVIGVAILSASFTIVSSRLSDSQFPIKISVLDVWGAITVGFLSYFIGNKFIDSLRSLVR